MLMMQQIEAAERKQHGPEEGRDTTQLKSPEKPERSSECRDVIGDQFEVESRSQRNKPIQQQMQWMKFADLTLAEQIESGEDRGRPQDTISRDERLLIEMAHRQVKPGQVVEHEDAAGQQRHKQRCQERSAADPNQDS
jgi:hypothetical protein